VLAFLPFSAFIAPLPTAVMSAIVVSAVISLLNPAPFREYRRLARVQFGVALATLVATLVLAPRVDRGVLIGIAIGIAAHLWREVRVPLQSRIEGDALLVEPHGVLFFASAPSLQDEINALVAANPGLRRLVLRLGGLGRIDLTGALVLRDLVNGARQGGLAVEVVDIPPQAEKVVSRTLAASAETTVIAEDASNLRRRATEPDRPTG
jgi:SulP family sulfate permease